MVAISLKGLVKYILKFMFFIPTKPKTFNTTIIFYGNNFLTYHLLWYYVVSRCARCNYFLFVPRISTRKERTVEGCCRKQTGKNRLRDPAGLFTQPKAIISNLSVEYVEYEYGDDDDCIWFHPFRCQIQCINLATSGDKGSRNSEEEDDSGLELAVAECPSL